MRRVLTSADVAATGRPLGSATPVLDAAGRAAVEQATAEAHARGVREGRAAAAGEATAAADRAVAGVRAALDQVLATLAEVRREALVADVTVAAEIARVVLGDVSGPSADELLRRVLDARSRLDDDTLVVEVAPADAEVLAGGLPTAVTVRPDPSLRPGEARLAGRWGRADLTREGTVAAVVAAFEDGGAA